MASSSVSEKLVQNVWITLAARAFMFLIPLPLSWGAYELLELDRRMNKVETYAPAVQAEVFRRLGVLETHDQENDRISLRMQVDIGEIKANQVNQKESLQRIEALLNSAVIQLHRNSQ